MKKWEVLTGIKNQELRITDIVSILLENRNLKSKKEIEEFLQPSLASVTTKSVSIDQKQLQNALARIEKAVKDQEQIVVFGDYDVDGITGSAILWETLYALDAKVTPYIPDRKTEGYGLSVSGIKNLELRIEDTKLIITVDNGIVANEAVSFANEKGIDVIITDHHTIGGKLPDAYAIVHTTKLCGAGIAYLLSKKINKNVHLAKTGVQDKNKSLIKSGMTKDSNKNEDSHLELAALGTVADLVPLTGANRAIVFEGLKKLHVTKRPGLLALFQQARIGQKEIGVYEIGYIIGPRLNASGRIDSAMDSLRLLCTKSLPRAEELAVKLELINRERQQLLKEATEHAIMQVKSQKSKVKSLLIVGHESYEEGVIGLVAGKLVEAFYRPAIVLSLGENVSKASVRSISGFNIIEFLRLHTDHFVNVGGHPMAAGFTIETTKIEALQKVLEEKADDLLTEEILQRTLRIDCELPFGLLTENLYKSMQQLAPFGVSNPEPVFVSRNVTVESFRVIGKEGNHLKLKLNQESASRNQGFDAIAFGMGELGARLQPGDKIDIAYVLDKNTWNGETKLQLKVKDIQTV
jgi:single-stranded-DNA-specific exonuclease